MKKLVLSAIGLAALSCPAFAADLPMRPVVPVEPVFSWTGLYVGGNLGGHWGSDSITTASNPVGFANPGGVSFGTRIDAATPTTLKPTGATAGLQIGYNWQVNNLVFGIEGDANWMGGAASRHLVFPFLTSQAFGFLGFNAVPPPTVGSFMDNSSGARFIATLRPRVGYTFDHLFLYATAGVAFGSIKTTDAFCNYGCEALPPANSSLGNFSSASGVSTKVGWTAGAGAEWAITNSWSIKAEYLFVDLGSFSDAIPGSANCERFFNSNQGIFSPACNIGVNHKYTDNIARLGVNYHFSPW